MNFFEKSFTSSGAQIVYDEWGPKDGKVVLCVHYLTGNAYYFHALAECLATDGYRVLVPDLPGRGRSDDLNDPDEYNFTRYESDIRALLDHADVQGKIDWIGASMGGALGIQITGGANGDFIQRLALIDIGPVVPPETIDLIGMYVGNPPALNTFADMEELIRVSRSAMWGPVPDDYWRFMTEHNIRKTSDGKLTFAYDPKITKLFLRDGKNDLWNYWDNIKCPVLSIHGALSNVLTKPVLTEMKMRGPGPTMQYALFKDCGHVPSMTTPEQINAVKEWLSTTQT